MLERLKFDLEELVNEILNEVPEYIWLSTETTFLDPAMGGGQFVSGIEKRLRSYGHSDANIQARVFGWGERNYQVRYAVNKHNLIGQYTVNTYILRKTKKDTKNDMRFDFIVGNPPYSPNGRPIYQQIYKRCLELCRNDKSLVALVTPNKIIRALYGSEGASANTPARKILHIDSRSEYLKDKYFGVDSTFCWFIVQNVWSDNKYVTFNTDQGIQIKENFPYETLPYNHINNEHVLSILHKCFSTSKIYNRTRSWIKQECYVKDPNGKYEVIMTIEAGKKKGSYKKVSHRVNLIESKFPPYNTFKGKIPDWWNYKGKPGLLVTCLGEKAIVDTMGDMIGGHSENMLVFPTETVTQAENLKKLKDLKIYRFYKIVCKPEHILSRFLRDIKKLFDLDTEPTDKDLEKLAKLSEDEIRTIDEVIKTEDDKKNTGENEQE